MPESRLSIKAAQRPLYLSNWFTYDELYLDPFEPYFMNRSQTFACIAMFESGSLNIQPASLSQVMAMSIENSIYVAAPLLSDPTNTYRDNTIKRVVGNVGKPGIAMMIPPSKKCEYFFMIVGIVLTTINLTVYPRIVSNTLPFISHLRIRKCLLTLGIAVVETPRYSFLKLQ